MNAHILRPASVLLSATLLAIAAEPLPNAAVLTGVQVSALTSPAVHVTTGDVDGDGFNDLAIGDQLYWGTSTGWSSTLATNLGGARQIIIVPNLTGPGNDSIVRDDLVLEYFDDTQDRYVASLRHVEADVANRVNVADDRLGLGSLSNFQPLPAVGNFAGDSSLDMAWIDDQNTLTLATNFSGNFSTQSVPVGPAQYAAVAGIDWTGLGTGPLDLLLVHPATLVDQTTVYQAQLFRHGSSLSSLQGFTGTIDSQGFNAIYEPQITVGNIDGLFGQDFAITGRGTTNSAVMALSTGSISSAPNFRRLVGTGVWILPDLTGDGIDDLAVSGPNPGGLVTGRTGLDLSMLALGRPIPSDGQSVPQYQFGLNFNGSTSPMGLRPLAASFSTMSSPAQRRLLLADISSNNGSASQVLPPLAPQVQAVNASLVGPGPLTFASTATVTFESSAGVITGLQCTVVGSLPGDVFSDAAALPAGVTALSSIDGNGLLKRSYSGTMTVAEAAAVLTQAVFTPAPGGPLRTILAEVKGKADPSEADSYYVSDLVQVATIDSPAAPLVLNGPANGLINQPFTVRISGGTAPYAIATVIGATAVIGTEMTDANGTYTPITVTPTQVGSVAMTVSDSQESSTTFTTAISAPALALTGPAVGIYGQALVLRLSGGVAGYTVSSPGATTVLGTATSDANGAYTPVTVTPTAVGSITVTVVDSIQGSIDLVIDVSAPALVVTGPATGLIGQALVLRLSGGVAGYTVAATGATAVLGQPATDANGTFTPITVTPSVSGTVSVTVTDSRNSTTTFTLTASPQPLAVSGPTTANVGQNVTLLVNHGVPGYALQVTGGIGLMGTATGNGTAVFVIPSQAGNLQVAITDAAGAVVTYVIAVTALPVASQPSPVIPASVGGQTLFGAICPGSLVGVQSLRSAFAASNTSRARGFTWDGPSQTYRELPAEPTAGLQPTDGVFLASRVALDLEVSGPAMPPGTTLVLNAGWNFVGIGPVQLSSGVVVRTHGLLDDFELIDLAGTPVPTIAMSQAYGWNGTTYSTNPVLTSGVAYFIKNVSSPAKTLLLRRKNSDVDTRSVQVVGFAQGVEAPPAPPATQAAERDESSGSSCGTGSGIAALLMACLAFIRLRLRR